MMLCDSGADVSRIDPPSGPAWKHPANAILQRGKRSIVLDLRTAADRGTAQRLIESADLVIENFRPGMMNRFGLGPLEMTGANQRLIYCSIPGFGSDDPRAALPAWKEWSARRQAFTILRALPVISKRATGPFIPPFRSPRVTRPS